MRMMKAVVKRGADVVLATIPRPSPRRADDVLIRVGLAGVCRTDLHVARGRLPGVPDPLTLGHEFAGTVEERGTSCGTLEGGDRVAVFPIVPCLECVSCREGRGQDCLERAMLGVDRDGAFAEYVVVPARCVRRLPAGVSDQAGAYAEPVAAALAVLNAGLRPGQSGLILGRNRFATLIREVLLAHGFGGVAAHDPSAPGPRPDPHSFDFVIETSATPEALAESVRAARPRGTVVLRSRQPWPAAIDLAAALPKELTFRAVNYGPFDRAIGLLAEGRLGLDGLLGPVYPLEDFARAFEEAGRDESRKVFLTPACSDVRDR
jgi:threonine dehydrogenase-like Zn-dependent dehydrogenase